MRKITALTYFEIKKLVSKNLILIFSLFLFFDVFNIIKNYASTYDISTPNGRMECGRYELYLNFSGEIDDEKYKSIENSAEYARNLIASGKFDTEYNPDKYYSGYAYGEAMIRTELFDEVKRLMAYSDHCNELSEKAEKNAKLHYISDYKKLENKHISDLYSDRKLGALTNSSGFAKFFDYKLTLFIITVLSVIGAVSIFTSDCENRTLVYINSSVNGGRTITFAKLVTLISYVFIINLLLFSVKLILFTVLLKLDGFSEPIYILKEFCNTPLDISIAEYLALDFVMIFIGSLIIAVFTSVISMIFSNQLISLGFSFLLVAVFMTAKAFCTAGAIQSINVINPISLILFSKLTRDYNVTDVFGMLCDTYFVCITASVILLVTGMLMLFIKGDRYEKSRAI